VHRRWLQLRLRPFPTWGRLEGLGADQCRREEEVRRSRDPPAEDFLGYQHGVHETRHEEGVRCGRPESELACGGAADSHLSQCGRHVRSKDATGVAEVARRPPAKLADGGVVIAKLAEKERAARQTQGAPYRCRESI